MGNQSPKPVDVPALCNRVQQEFPERFRKDGWYLTTTAALIACGKPALTPEARKALVRRIRETMIKCIILNGIPIVMEAFAALAKVEKPEDQDKSFTRQQWQADEKNHKRGLDVLEILYKDENDRIWGSFGSYRDIPWISTDISYGLFLANHTILDIVESELVILPAIMCQNLKMATHWHLRGCLRVGMSRTEVAQIQKAIELIAEACGKSLSEIGTIVDVAEE